MNTTTPRPTVHVVSTGSVRIHPEHVARTRAPLAWWLFTSRRWTDPLPINVYVIERPDGLVLFDAGQDPASVSDPHYFPGGVAGRLYSHLAVMDVRLEDTLTAHLAAIGLDIADVHTVVLSHLHQDHIGALGELAHARIVVADAEWRTLDGALPELRGLMRQHIDLPGLRWDRITPGPLDDPSLAPFTEGLDLTGDGTLVVLPTPGHTPGSLSLLVRGTGAAPLLLVGDLTYDVHRFEHDHVPGVGSRRGMQASMARVKELAARQHGLVVLAAHDPSAAGLLGTASSGARPESGRMAG